MKDIHTLTNRFFDGLTTPDEEQQLYDYFAAADLPDDLRPLKQMFLDLRAVAAPCITTGVAHPKRQPHGLQRLTVAAAVIAAVGLSTVLHFCPSESYELSLYGKIYTDKATVMREVTRTMHVATDHAPDVDGELRQAFGNY